MKSFPFLRAGAIVCGTGVLLGAFGAHLLKDRVTAADLIIFETGARYQLIHGLALLVLSSLSKQLGPRLSTRVGVLMVAGIIVFSGSLYALTLSGVKALGAITPIGGVCLISAWGLLALSKPLKSVE